MAFVKTHGNTPVERRSRNAKVLQTGFQEVVDHLVFARLRNDEIGMFVIVFHKAVGIFAHIEEVCLLLCHFDFASAVGAFAVDKLALRPERFARSAIPALVRAFVYIALFIELFKYFLDLFLVICVGCAYKLVVGRVHQIPNAFDVRNSLVDVLLGRQSCGLRFELDLFAVLVRTCLKKHVVTFHALRSCDKVGKNDFVCVADVRLARCVGNCRSHIKFLFFLHDATSLAG